MSLNDRPAETVGRMIAP